MHFLFRMSWNKEVALSSLFLDYTLGYTIRKVHENQEGVELNETHQLLINVGDVNLMG